MTTKLVKELSAGDRIKFQTGEGTGIITKVERNRIIDVAPRAGGSWDVHYKDDQGEAGFANLSGLTQVELA